MRKTSIVKRAAGAVLTKMSSDSPAATDCRPQYPSTADARTLCPLSNCTRVSCQSAPGRPFSSAMSEFDRTGVAAGDRDHAAASAPAAAAVLRNCRRPAPEPEGFDFIVIQLRLSSPPRAWQLFEQ